MLHIRHQKMSHFFDIPTFSWGSLTVITSEFDRMLPLKSSSFDYTFSSVSSLPYISATTVHKLAMFT